MSFRWGHKKEYTRLSKLLNFYKSIDSLKVALPQDEWIHTDLLNQFVNEFNIRIIFSVAPESEWKVIYNNIDFSRVQLYRILTGYIDPLIVSKYSNSENENRLIDVGYRAFKAPPWLGKHGYLKTLIATIFNQKCQEENLLSDISVKDEDTILGDRWYDFLKSCKYFIGVEGGSTVLDRKGTIWKEGIQFLRDNPEASYEEVERAIFPDKEGTINLVAISPRHLECCITRTCQILVKGDYNGILIPNKHYIELKEDFSNINEVIRLVKNDNLRKQITEQAFNDIVASERFSYPNYVKFIFNTSIQFVSFDNERCNNYFFVNRVHYHKQLIINSFYSFGYKNFIRLKNLYNIFKHKIIR